MTPLLAASFFESGLMKYLVEGGLFMWPILACGVVGLAVMIERWRSLKMLGTDTSRLRGQVRDLLYEDRVQEALDLCESQQGPVPAILAVGLRQFLILRELGRDAGAIEEKVVKAMDDYGIHIVAALERHVPILATIAGVAPMLGFLGTVQGMVVSFEDIVAKQGTANTVVLAAAGIKVALLTTVFGLVVGIPTYVAYNYFTGVINRFVLEVEESASELIESVTLRMALGQPQAET
jgi:biopolymer transport protein ExbB